MKRKGSTLDPPPPKRPSLPKARKDRVRGMVYQRNNRLVKCTNSGFHYLCSCGTVASFNLPGQRGSKWCVTCKPPEAINVYDTSLGRCPCGRRKNQCRICSPELWAKKQERDMRRYYKKRGTKSGDFHVKVHEERMIKYLKERYPQSDVILGKSVGNVCTETKTHRYPDVLLEWKCYVIIWECDENAHRGEAYDCDWRRMNEIAVSLGVPVHFIRWNPHGPEDISVLGEISDKIMAQNGPYHWEFNRQFNATYIGYSDGDLRRVAKRKLLAQGL